MHSAVFYLEGEQSSNCLPELKRFLNDRPLIFVRQTVNFDNGFMTVHEVLHDHDGSYVTIYTVKAESMSSIKVVCFVVFHTLYERKRTEKAYDSILEFARIKGLSISAPEIRQVNDQF